MRGFLEWFFSEGYRHYLLPYIIILGVDTGLILNYDGIWTDGGYGATPWYTFMVIMGHLALIGANVGMTVHMIMTYKRS